MQTSEIFGLLIFPVLISLVTTLSPALCRAQTSIEGVGLASKRDIESVLSKHIILQPRWQTDSITTWMSIHSSREG